MFASPLEEIKKPKKPFNFRKSLLEYGFNELLVNDWLIVRKKKRASNTQTAFNSFIKQIELCNIPIDDLLSECVSNSWSGFKSSWVNKTESNGKQGFEINR